MNCAKVLLAGVFAAAAMTMSAFAFDVQGGTVETSSAVNFRAGASTSDSVLDKLYNGDRVAVLDEAGQGWYKAAYNGVVGYISSEYVALSPVMNIEPGGAKVTTEVLNMRAEPSTSASIVTRLTSGTVAKIIGINNGWLKVTSGSNTGYIHPDYVEVVAYSASPSRNGSSGAAPASGASGIRQFFRITLPLLKPTTFLVMILALIDLFKAYGLIISLTDGGPGAGTKFAVQYIYEQAFLKQNLGYASTLSMVLFGIMAVITMIQFYVNKGGAVGD